MAELPACEASAVTPQFEQFRSAPLGFPGMDIGYFRIDFQVNHRLRHTRTGPIVFVFKDTVREMVAQGISCVRHSFHPKNIAILPHSACVGQPVQSARSTRI